MGEDVIEGLVVAVVYEDGTETLVVADVMYEGVTEALVVA